MDAERVGGWIEREAARRREEVEREAARLVARSRAERTAVDAEGKLSPAIYAAVFASSSLRINRPVGWACVTR